MSDHDTPSDPMCECGHGREHHHGQPGCLAVVLSARPRRRREPPSSVPEFCPCQGFRLSGGALISLTAAGRLRLRPEALRKASEVAAELGYLRTDSFLIRWKQQGFAIVKPGREAMLRAGDVATFIQRNTTEPTGT